MRKAQITMESLLLYGAAILVVLLAIAALMYFGVFNFGDVLPQKCDLSASNVFRCNAYSVKEGGPLEIEVENTHSKSVEVLDAEFVSDDTGMTTGCTVGAVGTITPGATDVITMSCTDAAYVRGDRLTGKVIITYKFADSDLEQTGQGDISIAVG